MKTARDLMTSPAETLSPSDTLADAAKQLADNEIGSMPICDDSGVVGIVTDRDIVVSGVAKGLDVTTTTVSQIATAKVATVNPDDSADVIARVLSENQIRRVPVVEGAKVVGMVSQADVARELGTQETGEVVREISEE